MTTRAALLVLGASLGSPACSRSDAPQPTAPASSPGPTTASAAPSGRPAPTAPSPAGKSIGVATMREDGTIQLQLRAEGGGAVGDAMLFYPPGHPRYDETLKHLGGLRPGESKPVPPWP